MQFKNIFNGVHPPVNENFNTFPPNVLISYVSYDVLLAKKGMKSIFTKNEFWGGISPFVADNLNIFGCFPGCILVWIMENFAGTISLLDITNSP